MSIDTNRLVQIATGLKSLDQDRQKLLAELQRIAGGVDGTPATPRRGRPPLSWVPVKPVPAAAPRRRGRPPGSRNQPKSAAPVPGRKPRKGLTTDVVRLLADGNAYTAGDIVEKLRLSPRKNKIATIGATLFRLVKEGRVKKDAKRGYRAA